MGESRENRFAEPCPKRLVNRKAVLALFGALLLLPGSNLLAQQAEGAHPDRDNATEGFHPHHAVVLFLGGTTETKRGKTKVETGFATGVEWAYRFAPLWSIGAVVEAVGDDDIVRDIMVLAPVSVWPWEGLRFVAGPGIEFAETKNEFVLRLGTGYEFKFNDRFIVAPEFFVDLIGGDKTTYVYGIAFGLEFGG